MKNIKIKTLTENDPHNQVTNLECFTLAAILFMTQTALMTQSAQETHLTTDFKARSILCIRGHYKILFLSCLLCFFPRRDKQFCSCLNQNIVYRFPFTQALISMAIYCCCCVFVVVCFSILRLPPCGKTNQCKKFQDAHVS